MSSERKLDSFEEHVKRKQSESIINKGAKLGRATNLVTIPLGILSGLYGLVLLDLASDIVYSEIQKKNNQRIENQERGRFKLISRKSRLAQVAELKTITQRPQLKQAA